MGRATHRGPVGAAGARALLGLADGLGMAGVDGAGLLEVPAFANGRGLREAGVLPNAGPGLQVAGARQSNTQLSQAAGKRRLRIALPGIIVTAK